MQTFQTHQILMFMSFWHLSALQSSYVFFTLPKWHYMTRPFCEADLTQFSKHMLNAVVHLKINSRPCLHYKQLFYQNVWCSSPCTSNLVWFLRPSVLTVCNWFQSF